MSIENAGRGDLEFVSWSFLRRQFSSIAAYRSITYIM